MIRINLLKPGKKELKEAAPSPSEEVKGKQKLEFNKLFILVFVVLIAALFLTQRNSLNKEKNLMRNAQEEKNKLQHVTSKLNELEQQKALYERKINLITELKLKQELPVRIMDELSRSLPDWVWLTEATYDKQNIQIKGKALSNSLIADFISSLENSSYFSSVNLISSVQKNIRNDQFMEFSMTAKPDLAQKAESQEPQKKATPREKT
ncbi:MAG: PilN domain-containing protein [Candidatus Aminicenantaceae bacterium]